MRRKTNKFAPRPDITDEQIVDLYVNKKLTARKIAKDLNCSHQLIFDRLAKADIPSRPLGGWKGFRINREELIDLYVVRGLEVRDIARQLDCSLVSVYEILKEKGIPLRDYRRTRRDVKDEAIVDLYIKHKLSLAKVAKRLGCSAMLIHTRLKKLGIPRRPCGRWKL